MASASPFDQALLSIQLEGEAAPVRFSLAKTYHSTDHYYLEVRCESTPEGDRLELQLHPKAGSLSVAQHSLVLPWPNLDAYQLRHYGMGGEPRLANSARSQPFAARIARKYLGRSTPLTRNTTALSISGIMLSKQKHRVLLKSNREDLGITYFARHSNPEYAQSLKVFRQRGILEVEHSISLFDLALAEAVQSDAQDESQHCTILVGIPLMQSNEQLRSLVHSTLMRATAGRLRLTNQQALTTRDLLSRSRAFTSTTAFAKTCHNAAQQCILRLSPLAVPAGRADDGLTIPLVADASGTPVRVWSTAVGGWIHLIDPAEDVAYAQLESCVAEMRQLPYNFQLHDLAGVLLHTPKNGALGGKRWSRLRQLLLPLAQQGKLEFADLPDPLCNPLGPSVPRCDHNQLQHLPRLLPSRLASQALSWHPQQHTPTTSCTSIELDELPKTYKGWIELERAIAAALK